MKYSMHCRRLIRLLPLLLLVFACNHPEPPIAEVIPGRQGINGSTYTDPYKYLGDPKDPKTADYIRAENEFADHYFDRISKIKNRLLKEFEAQDSYGKQSGSIPVLIGVYFYYDRTPDGKSYPVHYRKLNGREAKEEAVLDENLLAGSSPGFKMNQFLVSPDDSRFLFTYTVNNERSRLIIRTFNSRSFTDSIIGDITSAAWAGNGQAVVYVKGKKEVLVHQVGTPVEQDKPIYLENRDDLFVDVELSHSEKYIFIVSRNNGSTEYHFVPADLRSMKPILIESMRNGRTYLADHFGADFFLILSDQGTSNHKLFKSFISNPSERNWITVLEGKDGYNIEGYNVIEEKFLVLTEKKDLFASLRLIDLSYGGKDNKIIFKEPGGHIRFLYYLMDEQKIVFTFSSILTPVTVYSYGIESRKLSIRRQPAIKGYKKENYICDLIWAASKDGTRIPVSMIHKKGMRQSDGKNPLSLEAFGSFGYAIPPDFNPEMISLLDRGLFIAIAHIRGGGELGKSWWDDGKLMKKKNAVMDYIACADYLIGQGYTSRGMITAIANGAGGLIIGAAINERPELFRSAVMTSPFVDPIPELIESAAKKINPDELAEFGNPNLPDQFQYLFGYSPYNNIRKQEYPAMLFRCIPGGQKDYSSGPLKMIARLRASKTDNHILLIKTDDHETKKGITGKSGDNKFRAENWAFILDQYGINEK
jgi:oligopeptidase B